MLRLQDRVVLVFGGGQGIGRGCALAMASEGATVVVADRNSDTAAAVAAEVEKRGASSLARTCDVVDRPVVQSVIDDAVTAFGRVDGVVNLAYAGTTRGPIESLTVEKLERELVVDVVGSFNTMMLALAELKKTKGSVVNFSSGAAIEGTPGLAGYAAAKAGVRALSHAAANELGVYGVRVNSVCPLGHSPSVDVFFEKDPEGFKNTVGRIPLRRFGDCEKDVGAAVAFLVSDDARYVTGQTIMLDGGQSHL